MLRVFDNQANRVCFQIKNRVFAVMSIKDVCSYAKRILFSLEPSSKENL